MDEIAKATRKKREQKGSINFNKKEVYFIDNSLDPNELANAFIELSKNPKMARDIGLKGKDYALKNYSSEYIGGEINNFLENLISNN